MNILKKYTNTIIQLTLVLAIVILTAHAAFGQTEVATKSATTKVASDSAEASSSAEPTESDIVDLKEKIATKVAELRKKNQKAVAGTIKSIKAKIITIVTADDSEYEVKVDDTLTNIYLVSGTTKKEIKLTDLEKGNYIIVNGPTLDKSIDANSIYLDEEYEVRSGTISEVNKDDFSIKVVTTLKDTYTLDIENKTTQQLMNIKTLALEKIGFSKMKEGDTVHFVVKKTGTEGKDNRYSALKIVIIPQEYFLK